MKNLQFLKNFQFLKKIQVNFAIFSKFYRIFGENQDKIQKIYKYAFVGGSGGGAPPPDDSEFMEIRVEKSMETCNCCIVLMEFLPFFKFFNNFIEYFAGIVPIIQENMVVCICRGFGGRSPPKLENFKQSYSKLQWKPAIF